MHHLFVADLPCAVISLALIHSTSGETRPCDGESLWWAEAMLWCKGLLMVWAALSTITQLLLTGNCGTSLRGSVAGSDGSVDVDTPMSVVRASIGSLTASVRVTRTSQWVVEGGQGLEPQPEPAPAYRGGSGRSSTGEELGGSE